ncbi:MAG: hypothetical protein AAB344_07695, partial [Bacteroidota bacterium]
REQEVRLKSQIPSTKSQINLKLQISKLNPTPMHCAKAPTFRSLELRDWHLFVIWCLCIGTYLGFAICVLEFDIWSLFGFWDLTFGVCNGVAHDI